MQGTESAEENVSLADTRVLADVCSSQILRKSAFHVTFESLLIRI